ncbi:MAG: D-glucuronyl C5-epimerase family protein [Candidatus Baltobacteraceae bacterium]
MKLRRFALGFPLTWTHRRPYSVSGLSHPGEGRYFVEWDPGHGVYGEDWTDAPFDARGVLLSDPSRAYHPIRIAQFALHRYGVWLDGGDAVARTDVLAQAAWLRDHQQDGDSPGLYRFEFPWTKYGAQAGWTSAMAQGEAISVLLRAHGLEPSQGYADAAQRAAQPFRHDIAHGGVVWRDGPDVFFEEIANEYAPHVLNGCIFALWGIWELWRTSGDRWLERNVEECADTLRRWLRRFDTGWWTRYSLLLSAGDQPHIATLKYHQFHIAQMRVLAEMFDEPAFEHAARRWASYIERPQSRARVIGAALQSLPDRFLGRDTVLGGAHT